MVSPLLLKNAAQNGTDDINPLVPLKEIKCGITNEKCASSLRNHADLPAIYRVALQNMRERTVHPNVSHFFYNIFCLIVFSLSTLIGARFPHPPYSMYIYPPVPLPSPQSSPWIFTWLTSAYYTSSSSCSFRTTSLQKIHTLLTTLVQCPSSDPSVDNLDTPFPNLPSHLDVFPHPHCTSHFDQSCLVPTTYASMSLPLVTSSFPSPSQPLQTLPSLQTWYPPYAQEL